MAWPAVDLKEKDPRNIIYRNERAVDCAIDGG
jgi:hypothetical protein